MQAIHLKIPFNASTLAKQHEMYLREALKQGNKKTKRVLIIGIGLIILGVVFWQKNHNHTPITFILGCFYFGLCVEYYFRSVKIKKEYNEKLDSLIQKKKLNGIALNVEFNEDYFHYEDESMNITMKWDNFIGFRIVEQTIFLDINYGPVLSYIFSKEEMTNEEYNQIIEFLKHKVRLVSNLSDYAKKQKSDPEVIDNLKNI